MAKKEKNDTPTPKHYLAFIYRHKTISFVVISVVFLGLFVALFINFWAPSNDQNTLTPTPTPPPGWEAEEASFGELPIAYEVPTQYTLVKNEPANPTDQFSLLINEDGDVIARISMMETSAEEAVDIYPDLTFDTYTLNDLSGVRGIGETDFVLYIFPYDESTKQYLWVTAYTSRISFQDIEQLVNSIRVKQ